jgi:uncharacterized protein YraI
MELSMLRKATVLGGLLAAFAMTAAQAAPGVATGSVNMRTGPGTAYAKITTIPAGAQVEVFGCPTWCQVSYAGRQGWASSNYISTAAYAPPRRDVYVERRVYPPTPRYVYRAPLPARQHWRYGRPWWDDRYHTWHDGHGYWYDDRWYSRPRSGFSFGFRS